MTGSSRPCLSLFKVHGFKKDGIIHSEQEEDECAYWYKIEAWQRRLLGKKIPQEYYDERDALEKELIESNGLTQLKKEKEFLEKWNSYPFEEGRCAPGFKKIWNKTNRFFMEEYKKNPDSGSGSDI